MGKRFAKHFRLSIPLPPSPHPLFFHVSLHPTFLTHNITYPTSSIYLLFFILGDHVPRQYGEEPKYMGDYQRLCPETKLYERVLKMKARIIKSD